MLKNDAVLKNGDNIFKSQVVESYLRTDTTGTIYMSTYVTGSTTSNPLFAYAQTPTATLKNVYTTTPVYTIQFPATGEASQKNLFYCGNLEGVITVVPYNTNGVGYISGDLPKFASQFPNLECLCVGARETKFVQDISNTSFPNTLKYFNLYDKGIQGDVGTISGLENVETWTLCCTGSLSGNFHDIKSTSIESTYMNYLSTGLKFCLNCLIDNNPNYWNSCFYQVQGVQMCADTINMENLTYVNWYMPYNDVIGDASNWCFNTGITHFYLTTRCINADMTNWNIPETSLNTFYVSNQNHNQTEYSGDLSAWTLPDTMQSFSLSYTTGVTDIPSDFSNTDIRSLQLGYLPALSGDVTTWILSPNISTISIYNTSLYGNLGNFNFPSGITSVQFRSSCFTGDIANVVVSSKASNIYLEENDFCGNAVDFFIPSGASYINLSNRYNCISGSIYFDLNKTYDTKCVNNLTLNNMSGVTGNFSNFTTGDCLRYLCFSYGDISADINDLDLNCISNIYFPHSNISTDISSMFTGTTNVDTFCGADNYNMSGDTTNWQIDNIRYLQVTNTALSGRLCHDAPYRMCINNTCISSCIDTDITFDGIYDFNGSTSCLQGNLANIDFNPVGVYRMSFDNNPNIYGSDDFANTLFVNRKNFTFTYLYFYWYNIGDTVSGSIDEMGDLGTWATSEWDLTEAQVNNLAAGTDYTGSGINVAWNGRQKMWWIRWAYLSGGVTKRYPTFNLLFS